MIKEYKFELPFNLALAKFEVDLDIFTKEHAEQTLTYFSWDYDDENDPIDEVMKKYFCRAIHVASITNYTTRGVIRAFNEEAGFCSVDGSSGITLIEVDAIDFYELDYYL